MNQNKLLWREHSLSLSCKIKLPLVLNVKAFLQNPWLDEKTKSNQKCSFICSKWTMSLM